MLNELNLRGQLCDLMIGDTVDRCGAESGNYVKLNDFFDAKGINMGDFAPADSSSAYYSTGRRARRD